MDTERKVIEIIAEQAMLESSDVTLGMTLEELGVDSMGVVEAIFAIEEAFDISVPFNANEPGAGGFDITTVGSIVDGVNRLVAEQQP